MRNPSALVAILLLNFVVSLFVVSLFVVSLDAIAQPPRGGDGQSSRGGGGPPGGGFGGPPGGGGGDRGGGTRGGGPPGTGAPGGDRGGSGFDPAAMLSRLDANGNGSIDPDEMQGPARFMLDRIARDNPEIASAMSSSKPISLSKITKAFEKMRGDSGSSSSSSNNSSSNSSSNTASSKPKEPQPLVPGFGTKKEVAPILGFGMAGGVASTVKIEAKDIKEAEERISRYDKNKDGVLDEKEIAGGSWRDEAPLTYDRNGDKKLSVDELAVRYAKRRMAEETDKTNKQTASNNDRDKRRGDNRSREPEAPASPWSNQASYKFTPKSSAIAKTPGLPEWFAGSDANNDGQVMMNEYASNWDEATIKEFGRFDTNGDGAITAFETLAAVKQGVLRGSAAMVASSSNASSSSSRSVVSSTVAAVAPTVLEIDRSELPAGADERWVKFAALQMSKSDKDRNSRLTPDEWAPSSGDFKAVDKNGDGSISTGEIYEYLLSKKGKK